MGTISCHSNQISYPTGIKNTIYVEANVLSMYVKFRLLPHMVSEKKIFKHFYKNRPFLPPRQPIKFADLDKSHMKRRGLLNKHFCKKNQNIPNETGKKCQFPLFYGNKGTDQLYSYCAADLRKHFCKKKLKISPMRQKKISISSFPIISLWEL